MKFTQDLKFSIMEVHKINKSAIAIMAITLPRKRGKGNQNFSHFLNLTATVFEVSPIRNKDLKWLNPKNYSLIARGLPTC